jgi:pSer/pThr/pTyr-binding forkhead associated (FHA) protein
MLRLGVMVGGMLGLAIGAVEGTAVNSPRLILRGTIIGLIVGAIGGMFGVYFGSIVYNAALFGKDPEMLVQKSNLLDFSHAVLARALGWTFLGAFPGLAAGAATMSWKRAKHGLVGGLLGGFLGGFIFDLAATLISPIQTMAGAAQGAEVVEVGGPSRAIGFTVIGALTGFFIGLVEELLKQAWVRVLAGRNEGKDYILSKPLTVIGRDERADVPVFGDLSLAPQHAAIKMENNRHMLLDGGTSIGSVVNGQRIPQQVLLKDGDMIQLGQVRLLFREKATASKIGRPAVDEPKQPQTSGPVSMPAHLCPFCGAQKDASGNCLCTVPGGVSPGVPVPQPTHGADSGGYGGMAAMSNGIGTRLTALDGPYAGSSFPLQTVTTSIGRDQVKDISLANDSTISRTHAHVNTEGGNHVLYDDGSSNGTFVNNVRITVQTLAPGDVIQFGASKFRYE